MMNEEITKKWEAESEIPFEELLNIVQGVSQVYPMIVLANLTQNTYSLLRNEDFLCNDVDKTGCYDELIENNAENIHPNYQALFQECFSREHLIKSFKKGKTEVYAELYQKNKDGQYQWVSTHVIRLQDASGEIVHICLNRVMDGRVLEKHGKRK
jgi:fibrillarin-like rRNA methylase